MGDTKSLQSDEAIKKMKEIAENKTALFCTFTGNTSIETRPMHTQLIDEDGCFWFMGDKNNHSVSQIQQIDKVQLLYAINDKSEFLSVEGTASLNTDRKKIQELWSGFAKTWFPEGKDDPNIILIKVKTNNGFYWDTKHGKWVSMIKILPVPFPEKKWMMA
ncbi:MAG: pyridoxamine 5'-phosphate oxidase family protein [Bacteroidota bacterium]|nr:pyridoxamine 5'-phosphate oxidase family protein [Bacteroidota bacterium]